ncbi:universal stress protein UspA-like nucleotide-binding protein [Oleiphilus messinensis]|uniref:Universal stress protein UspA-like nucleotide-binding protein n=1 Tax=Oleiphilus messinensis TaxID=141451 RepID=A0A1Y0IAJ6_9GAMM|nr:universal stress protein [Oleiphilus messinensis]ARU57491.1 universal stress protein UspA-like nucleotide-binding protein [Oleiphilus messinensis]
MKKILLVVEPDTTKEALTKAKIIASRLGGDLYVLNVLHDPKVVMGHLFNAEQRESVIANLVRQRTEAVHELLTEVWGETLPWECHVVWARPIHRAILEHARIQDVQLIIKPTSEHAFLERVLFTHVDWHLIRGADRLVLFLKNQAWGSAMHVMAAIDPVHPESSIDLQLPVKDISPKILQAAHTLACQLPAEISAVHIFDPVPSGLMMELDAIVADYEQFKLSAQRKHRESFEQALQHDLEKTVHSHFIEGEPVTTLPDVVINESVDIMVMGAVAHSSFDSPFIGSTAEAVLDRLNCDLLIVHSGDQRD